MSKRVDTSGLDAGYIIGQAVKSNREAKSSPTPAPPPTTVATPVEVPAPEGQAIIVQPATAEQKRNTAPTQVIAAPAVVEPEREPEAVHEAKEQTRRKRGQSANYKETYLKRNEIKTRQCVYISYDVHALIAKLVRTLVDEGSDISVGGYIDTVLWEHLQLHKEEINELYRHQRGDLL